MKLEETKRKNIRLPMQVYQQGHAFFITMATYERRPWFKIFPDIAASAVNILQNAVDDRKSRLFAWCIMPDHAHLLLQDKNIVEFVRLFKGRLTAAARKMDNNHPLWQRSFYDHGLRKKEILETIANYIWHNPVRAGIVDQALAYKWSGSCEWPDWQTIIVNRAGINPAPTEEQQT